MLPSIRKARSQNTTGSWTGSVSDGFAGWQPKKAAPKKDSGLEHQNQMWLETMFCQPLQPKMNGTCRKIWFCFVLVVSVRSPKLCQRSQQDLVAYQGWVENSFNMFQCSGSQPWSFLSDLSSWGWRFSQLSTQISADNLRSYYIALGSVSAEFRKNECDSMSNTYNYNVNFFVSTKLNSTSSQIKHCQFLVGKSDRKQYREQGFKKPNKGTLSFEDVSAQILATSPLREIPQMAVIVRESLPKMPERFRNYRNIPGQRCLCWISPQMKSCIQKMGTQSKRC